MKIRSKNQKGYSRYFSDMQKIYIKHSPKIVKIVFNIYEEKEDWDERGKEWKGYKFSAVRWRLIGTKEVFGVACGEIVFINGLKLKGVIVDPPTFRFLNNDCKIIKEYEEIPVDLPKDLKELFLRYKTDKGV